MGPGGAAGMQAGCRGVALQPGRAGRRQFVRHIHETHRHIKKKNTVSEHRGTIGAADELPLAVSHVRVQRQVSRNPSSSKGRGGAPPVGQGGPASWWPESEAGETGHSGRRRGPRRPAGTPVGGGYPVGAWSRVGRLEVKGPRRRRKEAGGAPAEGRAAPRGGRRPAARGAWWRRR